MNSLKISFFVMALFFIYSRFDAYNVSYNGNNADVSYETSWGKERFIKEDYIKYFPYYKKYVETLPIAHPCTIDISKLPLPYRQMSFLLPFTDLGMYFNCEFIKKIFQYNTIENAIEIGSFYGLSTRHIASLLSEHGKLFAIDSWEYHHLMYEQFLSNVILAGLTEKIVPIKLRSDQAVDTIKSYASSFDLIYVDGDHETEGVLSDLELYYPLVKKTGVICGDDWLLRTVRTAVELFAKQHQLTIYAACNFWFLRDQGAYGYHSLIDADDSIWMFDEK